MDYTYDWQPLAKHFNDTCTWQYDDETHMVELYYQGQTLRAQLSDLLWENIHYGGDVAAPVITGQLVRYSFNDDNTISLDMTVGLVGLEQTLPFNLHYDLRFTGSSIVADPSSVWLSMVA